MAATRPAAAPQVRVVRPRPKAESTDVYSVRSGDTLGTIAERFGTTVDGLLALNPGIDPRALRVGETLRVSR